MTVIQTYMTRPIVAFRNSANAPTICSYIKDKTVFFYNFYKVMSLPLKPTKLDSVMQYNKYTKVRIEVMYSTHYWREVSCLTRGL
jgi:hypothetical protein